MRAVLVAALFVGFVGFLGVVGCGSSARSTKSKMQPDHAGTSSSGPDAGVAFTGTRPLTCPPAFPEGGVTCNPKVAREQCSYAEGSCYCGVTMPCSGVAHSQEEIATWPTTWQCTRPPPDVRPDGCPGTTPGAGSPCSSEGKVCSWGDCCFQQMTCTRGQWQTTGGGCPP
jgi:hypothetical protein